MDGVAVKCLRISSRTPIAKAAYQRVIWRRGTKVWGSNRIRYPVVHTVNVDHQMLAIHCQRSSSKSDKWSTRWVRPQGWNSKNWCPHKRWSMWFNSDGTRGTFTRSWECLWPIQRWIFRKNKEQGAAWLSSARAVRCWVVPQRAQPLSLVANRSRWGL